MDCVTARAALLGHHLGGCDDDERDRLDEHLLGCQGCLRAYLALRRALDAATPDLPAVPCLPVLDAQAPDPAAPRPSQAMRLRLRADVARSLGRTPARWLRALFNRKVPLYQAAAATLLVLGLGLLPRWLREPPPQLEAAAPAWDAPRPARDQRPRPPLDAREVIDTSRPEAASLSIL